MKKIGLLTYYGSTNHGTNLQGYAMYKSIKEMCNECDVEIINVQYFIQPMRPYFSDISIDGFMKDIKKMLVYMSFQNKYFKYSFPYLYTRNVLKVVDYINNKNYDIIFVGSDTVLELFRVGKNEFTFYWLPDDIKAEKIMISVSARDLSSDQLTIKQKEYLMKSIYGFKKISVRDDATYRLMKDLGYDNITKTPDPTFSLNISDVYAEKYVLKRKINNKKNIVGIHFTRDFKWANKFIEILKINNYTVVSLRPSISSDYQINDIGPFEYAGIFKHFKVMITHKFHDTVFCMKNKIPVITISPSIEYANSYNESKYYSILKDFEMQENYISDHNCIDAHMLFDLMNNVIDRYDIQRVENILKQKKIAFDDYLHSCFKDLGYMG